MQSAPINLEDLVNAYRKAKVNVYYSSERSFEQIRAYEADLMPNLRRLLRVLRGTVAAAKTFVESRDFLGELVYVPKAISGGVHFENLFEPDEIYSDPLEAWNAEKRARKVRASSNNWELPDINAEPSATFRPMSMVGMDFHVLSALWIMHVGEVFDASLSSAHTYGNRVRRDSKREVSVNSLGSFEPYFGPYSRWRNRGIDAMRVGLESGKEIVAITADASDFYHNLDADFMGKPGFLSTLGIELDPGQKRLHSLFLHALEQWARPDNDSERSRGLPVGLSGSAIIANLALREFDTFVNSEIVPLHYGRYVDDIILVMERPARVNSAREAWNWIAKRSEEWRPAGSLIEVTQRDGNFGPIAVKIQPEFQSASAICFSNGKNRVFFLKGVTGISLVGSIERDIQERASEHRLLPVLPTKAEHVAELLVTAVSNTEGNAESLRRTDALSFQRSHFALALRDFEAFSRDLPPAQWASQRHAFLDAFITHVLVLPHFFALAKYLYRVVQLAAQCGDWEHLERILTSLDELIDKIDDECSIRVAGRASELAPGTLIGSYRRSLGAQLAQSIICAITPGASESQLDNVVAHLVKSFGYAMPADSWHDHALWLRQRDLACVPFRASELPAYVLRHPEFCFDWDKERTAVPFSVFRKLFPNDVVRDGFALLHELLDESAELGPLVSSDGREPTVGVVEVDSRVADRVLDYHLGVLFATRPFSVPELYLAFPKLFKFAAEEEGQRISNMLVALRGFGLKSSLPRIQDGVLQIAAEGKRDTVEIAVASWSTSRASLHASILRRPEPDATRYRRLFETINTYKRDSNRPSYLVFPELSMPGSWFIAAARKLSLANVALIAGVDYQHLPNGQRYVSNEVWASLPYSGLEVPADIVVRQRKRFPAGRERLNLEAVAGVGYEPIEYSGPREVIDHGGFRFGMLICSELTNIENRAYLRGKVDALFIPEWNKDVHSFNALVEATALDVHAFVVQSNAREFGDSRIRAPYKAEWLRDVVRTKGGVSDYIIAGEIDVLALRAFQSWEHSPDGPFKPTPEGFTIAQQRLRIPL